MSEINEDSAVPIRTVYWDRNGLVTDDRKNAVMAERTQGLVREIVSLEDSG